MDLTADARREALGPLRAAGYTERAITEAVEAIAAAAVRKALPAGIVVGVVADYLRDRQLAEANAVHARAVPWAHDPPGDVVPMEPRRRRLEP